MAEGSFDTASRCLLWFFCYCSQAVSSFHFPFDKHFLYFPLVHSQESEKLLGLLKGKRCLILLPFNNGTRCAWKRSWSRREQITPATDFEELWSKPVMFHVIIV